MQFKLLFLFIVCFCWLFHGKYTCECCIAFFRSFIFIFILRATFFPHPAAFIVFILSSCAWFPIAYYTKLNAKQQQKKGDTEFKKYYIPALNVLTLKICAEYKNAEHKNKQKNNNPQCKTLKLFNGMQTPCTIKWKETVKKRTSCKDFN